MKIMLASLLLLLVTAFASSADAANNCLGVAPPTMQLKLQNNSSETIYAYIETPQIFTPNSPPDRPNIADLWLQAQCATTVGTNYVINPGDTFTRLFWHTRLVRAWLNIGSRTDLGNSSMGTPPLSTAGIPPGASVTVTLPFYTQVRSDVTEGNLGTVADQFIDWWDAVRLVVFYRVEGAVSIFDANSPQPVAFNASGAAAPKPSCQTQNIPGNPVCNITYNSYVNQPWDGVGFQLQEFTLASAEGPPPGGSAALFTIDSRTKPYPFPNLNYNVSSLDSVYLPVAIGPMDPTKIGQPPIRSQDDTRYVGSAESVSDFVGKVRAFSGQNGDGSGWAYYIPEYFDSTQTVQCVSPEFPQGTLCWFAFNDAPCSMNTHFRIPNQYVFPKIPGVANLLVESFNGVTSGASPNPPKLSSIPNYQMLNGFANNLCHDFQPGGPPFINPPKMGTWGQQLFDLWTNCTTNGSFPDVAGTCAKIKDLNMFFLNNYHMTCSHLTPDLYSTIYAVYGWTNIVFGGCGGPPLKTTTGPITFPTAFGEFCDLQYNYLTLPNLPTNNAYIFSPYTMLLHSPNLLSSTAYAFSVDDGVSFRQIHGSPGMLFAFAGTAGLDFPTRTPVPNNNPNDPGYYKKNCNPNK